MIETKELMQKEQRHEVKFSKSDTASLFARRKRQQFDNVN
jgi:hypothetical protein